MGKFSLPRKISKKTITKLFLLLVFVLSGYYFFPYLKLNSNSEKKEDNVLQAVTGTGVPVYKIDSYVMKDVIRPTCDKDQPYFDFFCRKTDVIVSPTGTRSTKISRLATFGVAGGGLNLNAVQSNLDSDTSIQNAGIEFYGNPVLEEILGVPVLAYYGGIYEIVLNQNPQKVVNLTRNFKTKGNVGYTAGCKSSWSPSNLGKKGNTLLFGGGGLEGYDEMRCYDQQVYGANKYPTGFGTSIRGDVECKNLASSLGIATLPNCKLSSTSSCWDGNYRCRTLNDIKQDYRVPFITRLTFSKKTPDENGSTLLISAAGGAQEPPPSGGAGVPDAYSFCRGKTKNSCSEIFMELAYGDKQVLQCTDTWCNDKGTNNPPQYGMPVSIGGPVKSFYKRVYARYGFNPVWQDTNDLTFIYGGYDTPYTAYSAPRRVDIFQVESPYWRGGTSFRKYRVQPTLYDGMLAVPSPYLLGLDWDRLVLDVKTGGIQDYVSDKYFFSLQYRNNSLILTRFLPTGYCGGWYFGELKNPDIRSKTPCLKGEDKTYYDSISIPNVSLAYTRNITFNINSSEDVDFMIAPNFKDSLSNPNAQTRMFRAQNFNSPKGSYKLYELTPQNGGYQFLNPAPGNNAPLTFRYYNNADTDPTNDFAVFVSRNYVFSSKIPPSPPVCTPNYLLPGGGLSLTNTNPNSNNFGVKPNDYLDTTTAILNYSFNQPLSLKCSSGDVSIPAGTVMTLNIYDGISKDLVDSFDSPLLSDRKSIKYNNINLTNFSKYFYQITFDFQDNTYNFPLEVDINRYFTLESKLGLLNFFDDESATPNERPRLTITKNLKNTQIGQYTITGLQPDLNLNNNLSPNFFFDHNLTQAGNVLTDNYSYKICSNDGKITKIAFYQEPTSPTSITNDYLTASISNDCVNLNYRSTDKTSYGMIPQDLELYVKVLVAPPSQNLVNFRVNGNVMVKNSLNLQYYSNTNTKLKGVVVSNIATGTKVFDASSNFGSYFKIPYVNDLKSGINLAFTEDFDPVKTSFPPSGLQNYYLVSSTSTQIPSTLKTIDVFASLPSIQSPTIIYVARDKALLFDLKDTNLATLQGFDKVYFVSADSNNPQNRIIFRVNCGDINNYREICINNASVNIKGGIYGNMKPVFIQNTQTQNRSFINIIQNPELLLDLQIQLKTNKIYNVTRSKTVFKYLNN